MTTKAIESNLETRLNRIINNIRNLPTPPIVFEQIQKKINDPDVAVNDIASILSEDPAMSVKVLKLTNSAFYGLSREIDSVNHAVMIIGLEAVKNLVLSASVLGMFKSNNKNKDYHEYFWRHSLSTALLSKIIAGEYKKGSVINSDSAFTSALIHDIGKMIICCFLTDEFDKIQEYMQQNPMTGEYHAEMAILGYNHALLGRQLAITWKLPERIADTVGFHHNPDDENSSDDYAHLICLADYISHITSVDEVDNHARYPKPESSMALFSIDDTQIEVLKIRLMEEYMKAETFLSIAGQN